MDLTPGAHCSVQRNELNQDLDDIVDVTYELLDAGLNARRIVGWQVGTLYIYIYTYMSVSVSAFLSYATALSNPSTSPSYTTGT